LEIHIYAYLSLLPLKANTRSAIDIPPSLPLALPKQMANDGKLEDECPICSDIFSAPCRLLPCRHVFCGQCIDRTWECSAKGESPTCPFCRSSVEDVDRVCIDIQARLNETVECECGIKLPKIQLREHKNTCVVVLQSMKEGKV